MGGGEFRRRGGALLLSLAFVTTARFAAGDEAGEARRYADCTAQAGAAPAAALDAARAWEAEGGGGPARHCAALALIGLDRPAEAAQRLGELGAELTAARPTLAAEALGQAGQAWLLAGQAERALAAQDAALALAPDDVELRIDRSLALALVGAYRRALDDLDLAQALAPDRAEVLVLRASAHRLLDEPAAALADIERALTLAPQDPEALLERGMSRRLAGDDSGARADWQAVLALAPDGAAAETARANLARLDATK